MGKPMLEFEAFGTKDGPELDNRPIKSYGIATLVSNWYERRLGPGCDKRAITPGTYGITSCRHEPSTYEYSFKAWPVPKKHQTTTRKLTLKRKDGVNEFQRNRFTAFLNREHNEEVNVSVKHDDSYVNNMTTMCDISYRLQPIAAGTSEKDPLTKVIEDDLLQSYGNQTNFGYLNGKMCEWEDYFNHRQDISIYQETFTNKMLQIQADAWKLQQKIKEDLTAQYDDKSSDFEDDDYDDVLQQKKREAEAEAEAHKEMTAEEAACASADVEHTKMSPADIAKCISQLVECDDMGRIKRPAKVEAKEFLAELKKKSIKKPELTHIGDILEELKSRARDLKKPNKWEKTSTLRECKMKQWASREYMERLMKKQTKK